MAATVNVNGRVFDQEHAFVSVFDHGFLYGEGVYETLRTYNGQPFLFDRHMQRLRKSRWPGFWLRSPGSFRFPGRRSCIA